MKLKLLLFLSLVAACIFIAQPVQAQAVKRMDLINDSYYGWPNFVTWGLRVLAENITDDPNLKVRGVGPFGNRTQLMVSNKIGVGLEFFYANTSAEYTDNAVDSSGNSTNYTYKLLYSRPRFLARVDFHMGNSKRFDPYFALGLGYSAARLKLTTDDPSFVIEDYDASPLLFLVPPVAYRMAFGFKIYFVKFMGAGMEFGLGGPLVTFGLSAKFGLIPSIPKPPSNN